MEEAWYGAVGSVFDGYGEGFDDAGFLGEGWVREA